MPRGVLSGSGWGSLSLSSSPSIYLILHCRDTATLSTDMVPAPCLVCVWRCPVLLACQPPLCSLPSPRASLSFVWTVLHAYQINYIPLIVCPLWYDDGAVSSSLVNRLERAWFVFHCPWLLSPLLSGQEGTQGYWLLNAAPGSHDLPFNKRQYKMSQTFSRAPVEV